MALSTSLSILFPDFSHFSSLLVQLLHFAAISTNHWQSVTMSLSVFLERASTLLHLLSEYSSSHLKKNITKQNSPNSNSLLPPADKGNKPQKRCVFLRASPQWSPEACWEVVFLGVLNQPWQVSPACSPSLTSLSCICSSFAAPNFPACRVTQRTCLTQPPLCSNATPPAQVQQLWDCTQKNAPHKETKARLYARYALQGLRIENMLLLL